MKKIFIALLSALALITDMDAQTLNVVTGNVTYAFPASRTGIMPYLDGNAVKIMGKTFSLGEITLVYVDNSEVADNSVIVAYSDTVAKVTVAGNIANYVTPTVTNAHVSILQSQETGDDTCGEITYTLSGASTNGEFSTEGSYKATIELAGLTLNNPSGAPLNIQNGKRINLSVKKNTENILSDAASGTQKSCIVCKGHLELKGKGVLNVYGNAAHGIYAKEYVELKNCTVNVLSAEKDGINCNQYFIMESGSLNISGVQDDGVQVSYKDETNRDGEDTGSITVSGGTIGMKITGTAAKGLKAEGGINVSGGTLDITASGGGKWDSDESKTKSSSCVSADGDIVIDGGKFTLENSGSGGKGINGNGTLKMNGGNVKITTTGGMFAYTNGTEYPNYTGNTDRLSSNYKSSPKGIRIEGDIEINGDTISVSTTGNGAEGIESKALLTINSGTVVVSAYDDAINSSSHMYIKGGDITVVSSGNDGLDSNGNMYISGGVIKAFGTRSPECGIDANEEENYSVIFTGGTLLAVGGGNSVPSTSQSTQPYVSGSMSVSANSEITLKNGSTTLATFTVPSNYSSSSDSQGGGFGPGGQGGFRPGGSGGGSSVLISCAGLTSGSSYAMTSGSSSTTVTATLKGSGGGRW